MFYLGNIGMKNIVILLGVLLVVQNANAAESDTEVVEMKRSQTPDAEANQAEFTEVPLEDDKSPKDLYVVPKPKNQTVTQNKVDVTEHDVCCAIQ